MKTLEAVKEDIKLLQVGFLDTKDKKHVETIMLCAFIMNRYPRDPFVHFSKFMSGEWDHIGGLTFNNKDKGTRRHMLEYVAKGLQSFVKDSKGINYKEWYNEQQDQYRFDWISGVTVTDRQKEIDRLENGHNKFVQIWSDPNERLPTYYIYGKLPSELIEMSKRLVAILINDVGNNTHEIQCFVDNPNFHAEMQKIAYDNDMGIHKDLDFQWTGHFYQPKPQFDYTELDRTAVTLRAYQKGGVIYGIEKQRMLLADDMGLGKTVQSIYVMHYLNGFNCIIVAPPTVIYNWQHECEMALGFRPDIYVPGRKKPYGKAVIVSYGHVQHLSKLTGYKGMIIDESHYIKSEATKRFKAIYEVIITMRDRILLSGTPIQKHTSDLIPQLIALGYLDQRSKQLFKRRYCSKSSSIADYQELNLKLRNMCMMRRLKSEVDIQLPPYTTTVFPVDINNAAEYKNADANIREYLEQIKKLPKEQVDRSMRAEALIRVSHLKRIAAKGYRDQVIEFVNNCLEQDKSVLLFCASTEARKAYMEAFNTPYGIYGGVSASKRHKLCQAFQNDPNPAVMVINLRAGAEGQNLIKADTIVHAEKDWVPAKHDQARDRAHRMHQTQHVNEYFFVARDTIDERIMDILEHRRTMTDAATGLVSGIDNSNLYKTLMKNEFGIDFDAEDLETSEDD